MKKNFNSKWFVGLAVATVLCLSILWRHYYSSPKVEKNRLAVHSPLFDPGDKTTSVLLKEVEMETGKMLNITASIHQSKVRANQMQQTVLAYLQGPRSGQVQVPVPEGTALNEFYFTPAGAAVVDLSVGQVKKESVGFYEEALFVRGLIDSLTGNFFEIKQVKVLVEGQDAPTIFGHYALGTSEVNGPAPAAPKGPDL